jgi:hypothetical protein
MLSERLDWIKCEVVGTNRDLLHLFYRQRAEALIRYEGKRGIPEILFPWHSLNHPS